MIKAKNKKSYPSPLRGVFGGAAQDLSAGKVAVGRWRSGSAAAALGFLVVEVFLMFSLPGMCLGWSYLFTVYMFLYYFSPKGTVGIFVLSKG